MSPFILGYPWRALLEAAADAAVRARRTVVADAERAAILALAIVPAMAQARVATDEVPAIRDTGRIASARRQRTDRPLESAGARYLQRIRITAARYRTDQSTVRSVAELRGIENDVQVAAGVIAAVHPVVDVVPPTLDVAVLGVAVSGAVGRCCTGMILHGVSLAVVFLGAGCGAAIADCVLTIPISKLYEV